MRTPVLVLFVGLLLFGSGLAWFASRSPSPQQVPPVSPDQTQGASDPAHPPVDLARPAPAARAEPATAAPESAAPAAGQPAQPATPKSSVTMLAWWEYEAQTAEQLDAEVKRLNSELGEIARPLLEHQLEAGLGELLATDTSQGFSYQGRKSDSAAIMMVRGEANAGPAWRVELPREQFPDLYEVKDLALRLQKLAAQKRSDAWQPR